MVRKIVIQGKEGMWKVPKHAAYSALPSSPRAAGVAAHAGETPKFYRNTYATRRDMRHVPKKRFVYEQIEEPYRIQAARKVQENEKKQNDRRGLFPRGYMASSADTWHLLQTAHRDLPSCAKRRCEEVQCHRYSKRRSSRKVFSTPCPVTKNACAAAPSTPSGSSYMI